MGFLSLRTPEYSGNVGLKDQLLALKWTKDHIHSFGGDSNKITVYGISAGSVLVHMHVLAPASQGLFQRAILASGVSYNPWSVTYLDHFSVVKKFGEVLFILFVLTIFVSDKRFSISLGQFKNTDRKYGRNDSIFKNC